MLELYLIRHPKTVYNEERKIQGQLDVELIPGWEESVDSLTEKLALQGEFSAFLTSDLMRANKVAYRVVERLIRKHGKPLVLRSTPDLRERHWGVLQGKSYDEVDTQGKDIHHYLLELDQVEGGESFAAIEARVKRVDAYLRGIQGDRVCIIGHQFTNTYLSNFELEGNILARPYEDWPHLLIKQISFPI